MPSSATIRALCAALPLAGLAACSGAKAPDFPPVCPQVAILRDAADITLFRGAGTDLTDMVIDGRIVRLDGACALDDPTHLRTKLNVTFSLTRGPAAPGRTLAVDYFVSVQKGRAILTKQEYHMGAQFGVNSDAVRLKGEEADIVLPIADSNAGAAYTVLVGFQLTPQQLAFNRSRGVR